MSFLQRIYLSTSPYKKLLPVDERRLSDLSELDFLPKCEMGEVEFIGADLSLIYAEFHKAYEFHEIIETECVVAERDRYQISWFELESIITRWREVIDKQSDKETKEYWLEIERKLSDLFTYRKVIDRDLWSIEYEGES